MTYWREIAVGIAIAVATASLGAAVDVRDRVAAVEAKTERVEEVAAERAKLILYRLDRIEGKLDAMKAIP